MIINFTKDGWKLISLIPFSIKKNNKEIQIHRLYFQRGGRKLLLKKDSEKYNHYLQKENKENKKEETNNINIINKKI